MQTIERHDPWSDRPTLAVYREIDLAPYGAEVVPASGHTLYARKLTFAEALRLQQWVGRVLGSVLGSALAAVFAAASQAERPEDRAALVQAELMAALPLALDSLAAVEDWYALLLERVRRVACYAPAGVRDPAGPGGMLPLDEAALEEVFGEAPAEGLLFLVALVVEGIGPLPVLGRGRPASLPSSPTAGPTGSRPR